MDTPKNRDAGIEALARINETLQVAFDVFNSKDFQAQILVHGTRKDGTRINAVLKVSAEDPEAVHFFELYAGNLYAKKIKLEHFTATTPADNSRYDKLKVESEVSPK